MTYDEIGDMKYFDNAKLSVEKLRNDCKKLYDAGCGIGKMVHCMNADTLRRLKQNLKVMDVDKSFDFEIKEIASTYGIHIAFIDGYRAYYELVRSDLHNKVTLIFYWLDGTRNVTLVEPEESEVATVQKALTKLGYCDGALSALDNYSLGWSNNYEWDFENGVWVNVNLRKAFADLGVNLGYDGGDQVYV